VTRWAREPRQRAAKTRTGPLDKGEAGSQRLGGTTTNRGQPIADLRQCGADTVAAWRRRRQASWRLEALPCSCRDPWPHQCRRPAPSERMLQAAQAAGEHLNAHGLAPLFDPETERAIRLARLPAWLRDWAA
jgi:hypothetical protein